MIFLSSWRTFARWLLGLQRHRALLLILGVGFIVRLLLVVAFAPVGTQIVDEQHYTALARNLVDGYGFGWGPDRLTSIRPPAYPFFVSLVWRIAEPGNLTAVRLAQIPLSLMAVVLVYLIGERVFSRQVANLSAIIVAFYPSLLFSGVLLLSETLFVTLTLAMGLGIVVLLDRPSLRVAVLTGMALGAAALTRSVLWPFLPVVIMGALLGLRAPMVRRVVVAGVLALGFVLVVGPWSYRNTRLQQTFTVVDTMGGLNLMMGNYEYTPDDRPWDAIALMGDESRSWASQLPPRDPAGHMWTEGTKEGWAKQQAVAFMLEHPEVTARRSLFKFADFWGIERDFIAGFQQGLYTPPALVAALVAALAAGAYVAVMVLGVIGLCYAAPDLRTQLFFITLILFICAVHTVVFGHPRYHLPLIPILGLYAAAAWYAAPWAQLRRRSIPTAVAAALLVVLSVVWAREILVRDAGRLAKFAATVVARN